MVVLEHLDAAKAQMPRMGIPCCLLRRGGGYVEYVVRQLWQNRLQESSYIRDVVSASVTRLALIEGPIFEMIGDQHTNAGHHGHQVLHVEAVHCVGELHHWVDAKVGADRDRLGALQAGAWSCRVVEALTNARDGRVDVPCLAFLSLLLRLYLVGWSRFLLRVNLVVLLEDERLPPVYVVIASSLHLLRVEPGVWLRAHDHHAHQKRQAQAYQEKNSRGHDVTRVSAQ